MLRGGTAAQLPVEQLVPGDIVLLEPGDHIPADCRLIEAFGVRVDNAVITGESLPRAREASPCDATDLLHCSNLLLAGTSMVSGQAKAVVFATGMQTEFGKIARLTDTAGRTVSPLLEEIAHLSRWIGLLSVLIGALFFALGRFTGVPFWDAFIFAIGIIVAMVPEGLLPTMTLALVLATQRMARRNVLIRHLPSVETLGSTTVICTDKTGTLTQNRMLVKRLFLGAQQHSFDLAEPPHSLAEPYLPFFLVAGLCHDLREGRHLGAPLFLGDPMEIALADMAQAVLPTMARPARVHELPFDTDRMRMSTVHATPDGPQLYCKGAPEAIAPLCSRVLAEGEPRPFTPQLRSTVLAAQNAMAEDGLRVLALAYRPLDSQWTPRGSGTGSRVGRTGRAQDPPRPEVPAAIRKCREAGIRVIMVTGDHPRTALAIAREIGLVHSDEPVGDHGRRLRTSPTSQLQLALDAPEIIFARVAADQKLRIVAALQQQGHDRGGHRRRRQRCARAARAPHIGIAMGITGTDVAREAADIVLLDDNFASIVSAIEEGRAVFDNIRKFLTYILASMFPTRPVPGIRRCSRFPCRLTTIQILVDRPGHRHAARAGARRGGAGSGRDAATATARGANGCSTAAGAARLSVPGGDRSHRGHGGVLLRAARCRVGVRARRSRATHPLYLQATTACLSAIIVMQIVNVFLCRTPIRPFWSVGLLGNPLILWGVAPRSCPDPVDRLHAVGQRHLRHRAHS